MAANQPSTDVQSGRMADTLSQRGEQLGGKIDALTDNAHDLYERGVKRARSLGDDLNEFTREQPLKSVLIAAGVGFVLGAVLLRR